MLLLWMMRTTILLETWCAKLGSRLAVKEWLGRERKRKKEKYIKKFVYYCFHVVCGENLLAPDLFTIQFFACPLCDSARIIWFQPSHSTRLDSAQFGALPWCNLAPTLLFSLRINLNPNEPLEIPTFFALINLFQLEYRDVRLNSRCVFNQSGTLSIRFSLTNATKENAAVLPDDESGINGANAFALNIIPR